jgi:hypothetical protein
MLVRSSKIYFVALGLACFAKANLVIYRYDFAEHGLKYFLIAEQLNVHV